MPYKKSSDSKEHIKNNPSPWFSTKELLEYLGISDKELRSQVQLLTKGVHYRLENPSDPKSQMLWRVDLVDELLSLPIPPLEKEAMLNAIHNHITCKK